MATRMQTKAMTVKLSVTADDGGDRRDNDSNDASNNNGHEGQE